MSAQDDRANLWRKKLEACVNAREFIFYFVPSLFILLRKKENSQISVHQTSGNSKAKKH